MMKKARTDRIKFHNYAELFLCCLVCFVSLQIFFPFVAESFFSFVPVTVSVFLTAIIAFYNKRHFTNKDIIYLIVVFVWFFWFYLCVALGGSGIPKTYPSMLLAIVGTFLCALPVIRKDMTEWTRILVVLLGISIVATFLISMPYLQDNIFVVRELAAGIETGKTIGLGGYEFSYCIAFLSPCFLLLFRAEAGWRRILMICVVVVSCIYSAQCGLFMTLLINIAGIAFYLLFKIKKTNRKLILFLVILALLVFLVLVGTDVLVSLLEKVNDVIDNEVLNRKLSDIIHSLLGEEEQYGTFSGRVSRYFISLKTFAASPIIGGAMFGTIETSGGHSMLLDYLAISGLLGTILFVGAFVTVYKLVAPKLRNKISKYVLWEMLVIFFVIAAIKGTNNFAIFWTMLVIAPLFILYADKLLVGERNMYNEGTANQLCEQTR